MKLCQFKASELIPCCWLLSPGAKRAVTLLGQATVVVVAKRAADDKPSNDDCVIYRYGSFCTGIEVFGELDFIGASRCKIKTLEMIVSEILVFVFRGHWKSRDCSNGQHCDGSTWHQQKCFGYHCYLPGKVNAPALYQIMQTFLKYFIVYSDSHLLSPAFQKRCAAWFWMQSVWGRFTQRATWWSPPKSASWCCATSSMTLGSTASMCPWPTTSV